MHSFLKGLQTDKAIVNTTNEELSDALNIALTTAAFNQFTLQSDTGNIKLSGEFGDIDLPAGFRVMAAEERDSVIYFVLYNPSTQTTELGTYPSPIPGGAITFRQTTFGERVVANLVNNATYDIFSPVINLEPGVIHEFYIERANGTQEPLTPYIGVGAVDISNDSLNRDRIISVMRIDDAYTVTEITENSDVSDYLKEITATFSTPSNLIKGYKFEFQGETKFIQFNSPQAGLSSSVTISELEPGGEYTIIWTPWTDYGYSTPTQKTIVVTDFQPLITLSYSGNYIWNMSETLALNDFPETAHHKATIKGIQTVEPSVEIEGSVYGNNFSLPRFNKSSIDIEVDHTSWLADFNNQYIEASYQFRHERRFYFDTQQIKVGSSNLLSSVGISAVSIGELTANDLTASFDISMTFFSDVNGNIIFDWPGELLQIEGTQTNMQITASLIVEGKIISNIRKLRSTTMSLVSTPVTIPFFGVSSRALTGRLIIVASAVNPTLPGSATINIEIGPVAGTGRYAFSQNGAAEPAFDSFILYNASYSRVTTPQVSFSLSGTRGGGFIPEGIT